MAKRPFHFGNFLGGYSLFSGLWNGKEGREGEKEEKEREAQREREKEGKRERESGFFFLNHRFEWRKHSCASSDSCPWSQFFKSSSF